MSLEETRLINPLSLVHSRNHRDRIGRHDSSEKARRARDEGVLNLFRLWIERSGEVPLNYKIDIQWNTPAANDLINLFFEQKYLDYIRCS